jgi:hypothetical protein
MLASPALIKLNYDSEYRLALQKADLALADSGLLVLLWRLTSRRRLKKISGISYLKCLFADCETRKNEKLLGSWRRRLPNARRLPGSAGRGFAIEPKDCYVADRDSPSS